MKFLDQVGSYLSKETLKERCPQEKLLGHTPDISKFRFAWFQPVWYYSPTLFFPQDKMEPGFSLKMADNTGDSFAYEILPGRSYEDIPLRCNPTVLVRCVVREREYGADKAPLYTDQDRDFKVFNSEGKDIPLPELDKQETTYSAPENKSDTSPVIPSKRRKMNQIEPLKSKPQSLSRLFDLDTDLKDYVSHPNLDKSGNVGIDAQSADMHYMQSLQEESSPDQVDHESERKGKP